MIAALACGARVMRNSGARAQLEQIHGGRGVVTSLPGMVLLSGMCSSGGVAVAPTATSLSSGLTPTTPTVTPTTLSELRRPSMAFDEGFAAPPISHAGQACFVTPHIVSHQLNVPAVSSSSPTRTCWVPRVTTSYSGHRKGGRRPKEDDMVLSPQEEERRQIRRERNKLAAARCRQRRLELTHSLQLETDQLDEDRAILERQVQQLRAQHAQLQFALQSHMDLCRLHSERFEMLDTAMAMAPPMQQPPLYATVKTEPDDYHEPVLQAEPAGMQLPVTSSLQTPLITHDDTYEVHAPRRRPSSLILHDTDPTVSSMQCTPSTGFGLGFESLVDSNGVVVGVHGGVLTPVSSVLAAAATSSVLMTPVCPERPTTDLRSPDSSGKHLVSL